ncbi:protein enabled isoform X2 [Hyalella azteca]|uniref:Protein enabled isoform X2 n=1 Tax=Hyalella azteca TaxID=294128 RepID=A0A979FKP0_HYAAZ|nr:protein enabled isoform X2 [Hyalella azteca]
MNRFQNSESSIEDAGELRNGEVSICQARASVMLYDDGTKKWVPAGSSSGLSKVQIYHHTGNTSFRVVGRKINDHEVVINCAIQKALKYNQATPTFHQWRDNRQVYGLNFSSKDDADAFAQAMLTQALEILNNGPGAGRQMPPPPPPHQTPPGMPSQQQMHPPQPPPHQQSNPPLPPHQLQQYQSQPPPQPIYQQQPLPQVYDEDLAYRYGTSHSTSAPEHIYGGTPQQQQYQQPQYQPAQYADQQPQYSDQQQVDRTYDNFSHYQDTRSLTRDESLMLSGGLRMAPQAPPPPPSSHHRNNSAPTGPGVVPPAPPPAPPAPPAPPHAPPAPVLSSPAPAPPPPPPPPMGGGPPPPPPPPSHHLAAAQDDGAGGTSLSAALATAKLRKMRPPDSDSTSSSSSGGSSGGSIGKGPADRPPLMGMSMMDEMAATLARRKAKTQANGNAAENTSGGGGGTLKGLGQKSPSSSKLSTNGITSNNNTSSRSSTTSGGGGESPKPARKRFGSTCDDGGPTRLNGVSGNEGCVTSQDLDNLREDLMAHITKEVNKCKLEIIEAIKMELNRR